MNESAMPCWAQQGTRLAPHQASCSTQGSLLGERPPFRRRLRPEEASRLTIQSNPAQRDIILPDQVPDSSAHSLEPIMKGRMIPHTRLLYIRTHTYTKSASWCGSHIARAMSSLRPQFADGSDAQALTTALAPLLSSSPGGGGRWSLSATGEGLERSFKFKTFAKTWVSNHFPPSLAICRPIPDNTHRRAASRLSGRLLLSLSATGVDGTHV